MAKHANSTRAPISQRAGTVSGFVSADLTFNLSAIMVEGIRIARHRQAQANRYGKPVPAWREAISGGLQRAWEQAREQKGIVLRAAERAAQKAAEAALDANAQEVARLQRELAFADMIDSTSAMLATKASIGARLAQLGA